jgi:hypothetical protein
LLFIDDSLFGICFFLSSDKLVELAILFTNRRILLSANQCEDVGLCSFISFFHFHTCLQSSKSFAKRVYFFWRLFDEYLD